MFQQYKHKSVTTSINVAVPHSLRRGLPRVVGCDRLSLTRADVEWLDQPKCGVRTHLGSDHKESSKSCVDKSHVCKSSLASTCNTSTFSTSWQILFLYFHGPPRLYLYLRTKRGAYGCLRYVRSADTLRNIVGLSSQETYMFG